MKFINISVNDIQDVVLIIVLISLNCNYLNDTRLSNVVSLCGHRTAQRRRIFSVLAHPERYRFSVGSQHLHESPPADRLLIASVPGLNAHVGADLPYGIDLIQGLSQAFLFLKTK